MSDAKCAARIRDRYLGHRQQPDGLQPALLHRIASDIASECGVSRLKAHRLACGWTVAQAVDAFHRMCRLENIKPRGLTARSWMDWEAGGRPNWDYQDLVARLFHASAVQLGWAADYSPAGSGALRSGMTAPRATAPTAIAVIHDVAQYDDRRRSLLHLPPDIRDFTGRTEQLDQIIPLIVSGVGESRGVVPIACLSGQGGTGKTTLAVHAAHMIGSDFPDGQMYTNLHGAEGRGQDPADVLAGFLRELGVDGTDIPEGIDERARMYRAQLAGQRILVVLDDAADEAQVRPLLPGSDGCAVLVTSRSRLAALPGVQTVALGTLPPDQAEGMLTAIVGDDRASAEPQAVAEIVRLCGYLPLAIRIAGARLVSRPAWTISWFASRLGDESKRLDLLRVGDLEVRASFALSYDSRDETERQAFRLLGLLEADFPAWNLAAVLETNCDEAEWLLEQLADAALVDIVGVDATGLIRYRLHDLLRDFARECLYDTEPQDALRERLATIADEYMGAARVACALVHPGAQDSMEPRPQLLAGDVVHGDPWGWLAAERSSLVALVEQVHAAELWDRTWQLAETLRDMFDWRADWRSWKRSHQLALDAARRGGDASAEGRILRCLGVLHLELGRYEESASFLTQATVIFADQGTRHQRAAAMRNLGDTYRYLGRLTDAIDAFTAALAVFRQEADASWAAGALNGAGDAYRGLSRWRESDSAFRDCLAMYHDLGDQTEEARAKIRYAMVFRDQHLSQQAIPLITEGLETVRQLGDRRWEARAMRQLAIVHRNDGDTDTAIAILGECLAIFGELEDRRGLAVTLRNRGDAHRLARQLDDAADDLIAALDAFQAIGDRRWTARTRVSIAGLCRLQQDWTAGRQHLDAALAAFRDIGDRPAEARALRELGLLLRDQGELALSKQTLDTSQDIFAELGDMLWAARVLASKAVLEELRGADPALVAQDAAEICRQCGIIGEDNIAGALREW